MRKPPVSFLYGFMSFAVRKKQRAGFLCLARCAVCPSGRLRADSSMLLFLIQLPARPYHEKQKGLQKSRKSFINLRLSNVSFYSQKEEV
jgi:hypothetical protein